MTIFLALLRNPFSLPAQTTQTGAKHEPSGRPRITRRAAALRPATLEELVDGGRGRLEVWRHRQQVAAAAAELEGVTFRPQLCRSPAYADVSFARGVCGVLLT